MSPWDVACPTCKSRSGTPCKWANGVYRDSVHSARWELAYQIPNWIDTLAANLAAVGWCARAFVLGGKRVRWVSDYYEGWYSEDDVGPWYPGCGRPTP